MSGSRFTLEVQPRIPKSLARLEDLANDLLYSWDHRVRGIFYRLDRQLWRECGHNPKLFLRRISQHRLEEASEDRVYMEDFRRVITGYDAYLDERIRPELAELLNPASDLVAYFCAEFGFHESFPIYSGGLGILAGDHCKAASDLGIPFVGVGLLYQHGYFTQNIDAHGNQVAHYIHIACDSLPIRPATLDDVPLVVEIPFPDRQVTARVWEARAGHIRLYFLDTDTPENPEADRGITYQLYGGDTEMRIQQELVLGIGGTRALQKLGLIPSAWHINEGHAAFQIIERCRQAVDQGLSFAAALEWVASCTLFTTHTPVAAGHDIFTRDQVERYLSHYAKEMDIPFDRLFALGQSPGSGEAFNMTALALRGSRYHNGVSRIHGGVASQMEGGIWPEIAPEENPIEYVTNGIHVPTFLAREWGNLFEMRFDNWQSGMLDAEYWERIDDIPAYHYWSIHKALKQQLLEYVKQRVIRQHERNGTSHSILTRMLSVIGDPDYDCLVMGFARRFATYKRATLLFSDPQRLSAILNDPARPGVIIFAGKAHPKDHPGQQLIKVIHELSMRPEFIGRIILIEGYDLALARKLVSGVDVWLNTPEHPLEASGTSGEKAAVNGAINLSILDGWWGEGYNGSNGWGIKPRSSRFEADYRNREEADDLLDIIEHEMMPLYYQRDGRGYSEGWVQMSKASMKSIIPRFNAQRMVMDYVRNFYAPAKENGLRMGENDAEPARRLAEWKTRVSEAWSGVTLELLEAIPSRAFANETIPLRVGVNLNGLAPDDVVVECLVGTSGRDEGFEANSHFTLKPQSDEGASVTFALDLEPPLSGLQQIKLRAYPHHPLLTHRFEIGLMRWV